ncbi:hypothetical protein MBEHAL_1855 [Halarchaeum acidiphilum MH1-52-1]|uniref:Uncharacterized protein n=1 Tax=Halarchaeum acidiphilum MH1-52-1 TaxID=1261545 RepID=U2YVN6_9EURY|nr:hypothetical protein MBEHAL_1855 [Halarchaeum acidiphilum MH1-52-1]
MIAEARALALVVLVGDFGLHLRHVHLARAVVRTALTADAEVEHLVHELDVELLVGQVAAHRLAQEVRAAARRLNLLVARAVRRAHHAAARVLIGPAATAAVAEFDHPLEAVIVLPREFRLEAGVELVVRVVAQILGHGDTPRALGNALRQRLVRVVATDLPGVEEPVGIVRALEFAERLPEFAPVELLVPLRARAAVAVLAGDGPAEFDDEIRHLVRDALVGRESPLRLRRDERANVQDARSRVTVERPERVVVREDVAEALHVLGEHLGGHRAVLDEREVLLVGRPREQDRVAGLPELPHAIPLRLVVRLDGVHRGRPDAVLDERVHLLAALVVALGVELHEQRRPRPLREHLDDVVELGGVAREVDERVVDELHRRRVVFEHIYHVLDRRREVVVREERHGLRLRDGFERDGGFGDDRERPLAPREQAREVHRRVVRQVRQGLRLIDALARGVVARAFRGPSALVRLLDEHVEVVPGDVALQIGIAVLDLAAFLLHDVEYRRVDAFLDVALGVRGLAEVAHRHLAEARDAPVREDGLHLLDVGVRLAVLQRVRPRRVVADGAADDAPVARGGVGRELQVVDGESLVQPRERDAGLDADRPRLRVGVRRAVHVAGEIEDDGLVDRLAGEARSAAPGEHGNVLRRAVLDDRRDVRGVGGEDDADRRHLVGARVRRVQFAGVGVESDLAVHAGVERLEEVGALDAVALIVVVRVRCCRGLGGVCVRLSRRHVVSVRVSYRYQTPPSHRGPAGVRALADASISTARWRRAGYRAGRRARRRATRPPARSSPRPPPRGAFSPSSRGSRPAGIRGPARPRPCSTRRRVGGAPRTPRSRRARRRRRPRRARPRSRRRPRRRPRCRSSSRARRTARTGARPRRRAARGRARPCTPRR